jgi:hypothetical protein
MSSTYRIDYKDHLYLHLPHPIRVHPGVETPLDLVMSSTSFTAPATAPPITPKRCCTAARW